MPTFSPFPILPSSLYSAQYPHPTPHTDPTLL